MHSHFAKYILKTEIYVHSISLYINVFDLVQYYYVQTSCYIRQKCSIVIFVIEASHNLNHYLGTYRLLLVQTQAKVQYQLHSCMCSHHQALLPSLLSEISIIVIEAVN